MFEYILLEYSTHKMYWFSNSPTISCITQARSTQANKKQDTFTLDLKLFLINIKSFGKIFTFSTFVFVCLKGLLGYYAGESIVMSSNGRVIHCIPAYLPSYITLIRLLLVSSTHTNFLFLPILYFTLFYNPELTILTLYFTPEKNNKVDHTFLVCSTG